MTITEFLLARIIEDKADVAAAQEMGERWCWGGPARVLADCEARDALMRMHKPIQYRGRDGATDEWCDICGHQPRDPRHSYPCATMKTLALPYSEHPDFRDEWRL